MEAKRERYTPNDVGPSPEEWAAPRLSEVSTLITNGFVGTATPYYTDETGIPYLYGTNVRANKLDLTGIRYITSEFHATQSKTELKFGDLLTVQSGHIGETAVVSKELDGANCHALIVTRLKLDMVFPKFLSYYMNSEIGRARMSGLEVGSTILHINTKDLKKFRVLLPSLTEQKGIAKILSTWDKAITTTQQLIANSQQQKKTMMEQLLTGKKRLLDKNGVKFSSEWEFLTFDEAFKVANKKSAQVKSSEYLPSGTIPIVDQGQKLIAGYCNSQEFYSDIPVIVFGDHTRCLKWIDFVFCPGADGTQLLDSKASLDKKFGYYLLLKTDIPNLGYSRHMRELKAKDFKVPMEIEEQKKIATVLSAADHEITILQHRLDALKQERKALMQQLLTGKRRVNLEDKQVA